MQGTVTSQTPKRLIHVWRFLVHALVVTAILCLGAISAWAQECSPRQYMDELEPGRLALVVGNHDYTHQTKLPSSATDAKRVKDRLIELDFKVDSVPDIKTKPDFVKAITDFRKKIEKGDLVVFYFSGHGFSSGANSFLAPTALPTSITEEEELVDVAMPVDSVRSMLEPYEPGLIIMILDACKSLATLSTHPDAPAGNGTSVAVSSTPQNLIVAGLMQPRGTSSSVNTLVAFSTFPGAVSTGNSAPDAMSLYTQWLVEFITREGEPLTGVLRTTGAEVSSISDSAQSPTYFSLSYTDPFLKPTAKNRNEEKKAWCSALKTGDAKMIKSFTKLHSVTRHTAAARRWLLDPPKPDAGNSTPVSAVAVERAWTTNLRAIRRLETSSFAFPRLMQVGVEGEPVSAADKELGLVRSGLTRQELATEKTGEEHLKNLGIEANTKDLQKLAFTIASMDLHEDVIATRTVIARSRPNDNELASEIQKGTKLQVSGLARGPNDSVWMKILMADTAPVYVKFDPSLAKSRSIVELGQSLKELIVTAVPGSLPDLIDERVLTEAVTELKNKGWEISWVSLANGAIEDETHRAIRDAQLAHAQFVLSNMGITREKMTAVTAVNGFRKDGVRIRFFGVRK